MIERHIALSIPALPLLGMLIYLIRPKALTPAVGRAVDAALCLLWGGLAIKTFSLCVNAEQHWIGWGGVTILFDLAVATVYALRAGNYRDISKGGNGFGHLLTGLRWSLAPERGQYTIALLFLAAGIYGLASIMLQVQPKEIAGWNCWQTVVFLGGMMGALIFTNMPRPTRYS